LLASHIGVQRYTNIVGGKENMRKIHSKANSIAQHIKEVFIERLMKSTKLDSVTKKAAVQRGLQLTKSVQLHFLQLQQNRF
jgi:hypothetical protein